MSMTDDAKRPKSQHRVAAGFRPLIDRLKAEQDGRRLQTIMARLDRALVNCTDSHTKREGT
jgi:hypothetical protein